MAKPIKETPVLKGKDAEKFLKNMKASNERTIDKSTIDRIRANYQKVSSLIKQQR